MSALTTDIRRTVSGFLLLVFIIVWSLISLKLASPPDVVPASSTTQFSAEKAKEHLKTIAIEPHPAGTAAHARVRDFIVAFCKQYELETQIQETTGLQTKGTYARAGRVQNILARLKGTNPSKTILVMSHYDSQPNTPGASDDGAGVAAMMEVIKILKTEQPLKNDVLFLFTDLEEAALQGAEAFVHEYPKLDEIGLLLNFEARGNAGISLTFEVSKNNSWLMNEFVKATGRSFANSIAYEIYKVMPNDSDFSMFRKTGIEGYNSAFIDGFAYYHSMADRLENMDLRSLQNHGNILLKSLRHFGNLTLGGHAPSMDAIFFNPLGDWLVVYPLFLDIFFVGIAIVLFVVIVFLALKKQRISLTKLLKGVGFYLGFIITSLAFVWLIEKLIFKLYPFYSNFYESNFYNSVFYLIAIVGLVFLSFVIWYSKAISTTLFESFFIGGIFILIILMIGIKIYLPTAPTYYIIH